VGTWGYGILDNDTAMDVKGIFEEALDEGKGFDAATREVLTECHEMLEDSDDGPVGYLALAAVQLEHGQIHDWLKDRATEIIDRRRGLALWREAGREVLRLHLGARGDLRNAIASAKTIKTEAQELRGGGKSPSAPSPTSDAEIQARREAAAVAMKEAYRANHRSLTPEELDSIAALLTDPDSGIRSGAAGALRSAHKMSPLPDHVLARLFAGMASDDSRVRERAAEAVFSLSLDLRPLWEATVRLLSDPAPRVRAAAALGIWQFRDVADASGLAPLTALLSDSHAKCRENAAFALSRLAAKGLYDFAALPHLVRLLPAKAANERAGAAAAISDMASLGATDPAALPELIKLLDDKSDLVVSWAALAVREYAAKGIVDVEALPVLTKRLHASHAESLVSVLKAIGALAEYGHADSAALPTLEKLSKSKALSGYGDRESGEWKHYTIGELAQPALQKARAALQGRQVTR